MRKANRNGWITSACSPTGAAKSATPAIAQLALANFSIDYAWRGRGGGYAGATSEQAWSLFASRLESARLQLDQLASVSKKNPAWYAATLDFAMAKGWPAPQFDALYQQLVAMEPLYLDAHFVRANFYSAKWHGSTEQQNDAIDTAVRLTRFRLGEGMYARLHMRYSDKADMFTTGGVDWKRMKTGFEQTLAAYPVTSTRVNYARFACKAGDGEGVKQQFALLGAEAHPQMWRNPNYYEYCQALVKNIGTGKLPSCWVANDTGEAICE